MKVIKYFILISLISFSVNAETWFKKNKIYSGEITFVGKKFNLPDGDWEFLDTWHWSIIGIDAKGITLVQIENNTIKSLFDIGHLTSAGKKPGLVAEVLHTAVINNKYDGCYEKSEYYYVNLWRSGGAFNCLRVRHVDLNKEIYNPDYRPDEIGFQEMYSTARMRKLIKNKNLEIPKILVSEQHFFYSQLTGGRAQYLYIDRNPEFFEVGKTLKADEVNSEYHKDNLSNFPKKEKFVNEVINKSKLYHKNFEKILKVRQEQKLNLEANIEKITSEKSLVDQLEKLNELLKSGAITNDEYNLAKKKLLK